MAELNSDFSSWPISRKFANEDNFNQYCVLKVLDLGYPLLTKELRTNSGAMPWCAEACRDNFCYGLN